MNRFLLLSLLSLILSFGSLNAQDEKAFRDILLYQKKDTNTKEIGKEFVKTRSERYVIDLNNDQRPDSFYTVKKDGKDLITFFDHKKRKVYSYSFDAHGPWSRIFRIQIREISKKTKVFLIYFYEGLNRYLEVKGTARLYFLTLDNNDFKTFSMFKGPLVWTEKRDRKDSYLKRKYEVSMFDYDNNGMREISVKFRDISRVFTYIGNGTWAKRNTTFVRR